MFEPKFSHRYQHFERARLAKRGASWRNYSAGFYREEWKAAWRDLDTLLYRFRVALFASPRERPREWMPAMSAPVSRYEAANAVIDGKLWVFGGFSGRENHALTRVDAYDPAADRWERQGDMPAPITHVTPARAGNSIWFAGSFLGDDPGAASEKVFRFDATTHEWEPGPPLPVPTASAGAAAVNGALHVFGGFLDRERNAGGHYVLDLSEARRWRDAAPMPAPRGHHAATGTGGKIYALGGQFRDNSKPEDLNICHVYDPAADRWDEVAPMPVRRSHAETSQVVHDGKIIVMGGLNRQNRFLRIRGLSAVSSYDPAQDRWTDLPPLPVGLYGACAQIIGGEIILTCGSDLQRFGAAQFNTIRAPVSVLHE